MNKPIINSIDASEWELKGVLIPITECKYFQGIGDCKESKGLCVANENCYYKQLRRLKQENEKLIKTNNDFAETHKTIGHDLYKECVSLRSELTVQKEVAKAFSRGLEQTEKLLGKYKQALEEIREKLKKYDANIGDIIIANPIQDCYDAYKLIDEVLNDRD